MNKIQLEAVLQEEGFKQNVYSLERPNFDPDEALCLRQEQGKWCIYYSERGIQTGKKYFSSEEEACKYFLENMRRDPTTRKSLKSGFQMPSNK